MNKKKFLTTGLTITQAFNGLSGLLGGFMLISDPSGSNISLNLEWLEGTPFPNFLIPGIVLFLFIGLGNVVGAGFTIFKKANAGLIGAIFGLILMIWIVFQVLWIGYQDFLQPLYFSAGMLQAVLGFLLMKLKTPR